MEDLGFSKDTKWYDAFVNADPGDEFYIRSMLSNGEKLSEELIGKEGYLEPTNHPRIKKVTEDYKPLNDLEKNIEELKVIINNFHYDRVDSFFLKNLS
jgi:FlaA1/EpsC-like NDP-sugar epimerase